MSRRRMGYALCLLAALVLGCDGDDGGGDDRDGSGGSGGAGAMGGSGGQGGSGGAGGGGGDGGQGGDPAQCSPADPAGLTAVYDAIAAGGGGTPTDPSQAGCGMACALLSSCVQQTCGVGDPQDYAVSVAGCLNHCVAGDAAALGAVVEATGNGACPGVGGDLCGHLCDDGGGAGGEGGSGGEGGTGGTGGTGGAGGAPDYTDCDPSVWCPAVACILDCADDAACAAGCAMDACGVEGARCMGCPSGFAPAVCDFCAANGFDEVCECDLGVMCPVIACAEACDDDDVPCREACGEPCRSRADWPCACTPEEALSCVQ